MAHDLMRWAALPLVLLSSWLGTACDVPDQASDAVLGATQALTLAAAGGAPAPELPLASGDVPSSTASSYYCCSAGQDPIHDDCRQMWGAHGVCLRVKWKCTTSTATGCTQQAGGNQALTSGE